MKVYATGFKAFETRSTHVFVTPGQAPAVDPAEWYSDEEKTIPIMFDVEFRFGVAEVADPLGKYMVANGIANRSKFIMPRRVA